MALFNDFTISGSGLYAYRKWMDALSDNIANINTTTSTDKAAFQERFVQIQAADVNGAGGGVAVTGVKYGSGEGRLRYSPDDPNADAEGYVRAPDMDLSDQMSNLILAQRGYQASSQAIERARNMYEAALKLGQ
jgi:flagellar basal-body rod protein FlgC